MTLNKKKSFRLSIVRSAAMALLLGLCLVTINSCDDDDVSATPTKSIVAIAQGNTNLTSLVAALTRFPDLVSTLSGSGSFTVCTFQSGVHKFAHRHWAIQFRRCAGCGAS